MEILLYICSCFHLVSREVLLYSSNLLLNQVLGINLGIEFSILLGWIVEFAFWIFSSTLEGFSLNFVCSCVIDFLGACMNFVNML